jgi:hypothetical protein
MPYWQPPFVVSGPWHANSQTPVDGRFNSAAQTEFSDTLLGLPVLLMIVASRIRIAHAFWLPLTVADVSTSRPVRSGLYQPIFLTQVYAYV